MTKFNYMIQLNEILELRFSLPQNVKRKEFVIIFFDLLYKSQGLKSFPASSPISLQLYVEIYARLRKTIDELFVQRKWGKLMTLPKSKSIMIIEIHRMLFRIIRVFSTIKISFHLLHAIWYMDGRRKRMPRWNIFCQMTSDL